MLDLNEILSAWCKHVAAAKSTRLLRFATYKWSDIGQTPTDANPQMTAKLKSFDYVGQSMPSIESILMFSDTYKNVTNVPQSYTFQLDRTRQKTYSWSLTEKVSFGIEISGTEGIPDVAQVKETFTFKFELEATQAGSDVKTETWKLNVPVNVEANTEVACVMHLRVESFTADFISTVELSGCVAVEFTDPIELPGISGSHRIWYFPIWGIFYDLVYGDKTIASTDGYQLFKDAGETDPFTGVRATTHGSLSGSHGIQIDHYVGPPLKHAVLLKPFAAAA